MSEPMRPYIQKIITDARDYVQSLLDENHRLQALLSHIQEESKRASEKYIEVEQQNTNLANLYVASYQLHGTLDRQRVLDAVKEIVINLIGSEELAIFELQDDQLTLADSFGIDAEAWKTVPSGKGVIGLVAQSGARFVAGQSLLEAEDHEQKLTACIPLKLDDHVVGVIAIFSLLAQKSGLEAVDFELFDLLSAHAATSLYCTRLAGVPA